MPLGRWRWPALRRRGRRRWPTPWSARSPCWPRGCVRGSTRRGAARRRRPGRRSATPAVNTAGRRGHRGRGRRAGAAGGLPHRPLPQPGRRGGQRLRRRRLRPPRARHRPVARVLGRSSTALGRRPLPDVPAAGASPT